MKALVGTINQEKALVGAFSVIVQLLRLIVCSTTLLWLMLRLAGAKLLRRPAAGGHHRELERDSHSATFQSDMLLAMFDDCEQLKKGKGPSGDWSTLCMYMVPPRGGAATMKRMETVTLFSHDPTQNTVGT